MQKHIVNLDEISDIEDMDTDKESSTVDENIK